MLTGDKETELDETIFATLTAVAAPSTPAVHGVNQDCERNASDSSSKPDGILILTGATGFLRSGLSCASWSMMPRLDPAGDGRHRC